MKRPRAKNCVRNFEIRNYTFFIFEKAMGKKIVPKILRFLSMLFLNISNSNEQKNCSSYFQIPKYAFLRIEKAMRKKLFQVFSDSEIWFY